MERAPEVVIVILNLNGKGFMEDCLSSIKENTNYPEEKFDIVVVDNGSTDGSDDMAEEMGCEVIRNGNNLGFDIGMNIGIYENPGYDYYLLLNNDTEVREDWLTELVKTGEEREKAGIIGPKLLNTDGTIQSAGGGAQPGDNPKEGLPSDSMTQVEETESLRGAALMIKSEVIEDIGYIDEIFTLGQCEEHDYCYRATEAGYKNYVNPNSEIVHKDDRTKDEIGHNNLVYLLDRKNEMKLKIMNSELSSILDKAQTLARRFKHALRGKDSDHLYPLLRALKEIIIDLPQTLYKRYNRSEYVPSYYCEKNIDYSKRYPEWR